MIASHPAFQAPGDENISVWRYMDFAKFVSLIQRSALFFPRSDCLGDDFEGSVPFPNSAEGIRFFLQRRREDPAFNFWPDVSDDDALAMADQSLNHRKTVRTEMFVSCWHMNNHESAAMWKIYCQGQEAIAIRSTYSRLASSLPNYVHIGTVRYADYSREVIDPGNLFTPFLLKRASFAHENELRAIAWSILNLAGVNPDWKHNITELGLSVPVVIADLIEAVHVSPYAPGWFRTTVEEFLRASNHALPVHQSSLVGSPLY